MALPSPIDMLNALVSTISLLSVPEAKDENPLGSLPPSQQTLFATLHVIFPSLLLPALDLLDRGLVTRVSVVPPRGPAEPVAPEPPKEQVAEDHPPRSPEPPTTEELQSTKGENGFYFVTSMASTMRRRRKGGNSNADGGNSARQYLVLLDAWHCSCPSFTLDAFASLGAAAVEEGGHIQRDDGSGADGNHVVNDDPIASSESRQGSSSSTTPRAGKECAIGGFGFKIASMNGLGSGIPCCKHLLACVLADAWPAVGHNVVQKTVGKAELAGMMARI